MTGMRIRLLAKPRHLVMIGCLRANSADASVKSSRSCGACLMPVLGSVLEPVLKSVLNPMRKRMDRIKGLDNLRIMLHVAATMPKAVKFPGKRISVPLTPEIEARIGRLVKAWGLSEAHVARRLMEEAPEEIEPVRLPRRKP